MPEVGMSMMPRCMVGGIMLAGGLAGWGIGSGRRTVSEENKAISNRVAEAIGRGDLEAFDELMAPSMPRSSSGA